MKISQMEAWDTEKRTYAVIVLKPNLFEELKTKIGDVELSEELAGAIARPHTNVRRGQEIKF